jgi:nucleoside-diphosphate-sugar epimerase
MKLRKILITGSFGFVGSNLSKAMKDDIKCNLIAIDIYESTNHVYDEFFSWTDIAVVDWNNIDVIIHLAGKAHDTKNQTNSEEYFEINTGLTKKVYDWFLKSNAKKFIFFSSVKAAADTVDGEFLTEEIIPKPIGPYGESKIAAEKYILNKLSKDKQVYILRPCMIHGPGNKGNLNLLYKIVSKGIPWPLGGFDNKRSFCSIDNITYTITKLIEEDIELGIYQVADDRPLSTNHLISLIGKSLGKKDKIWNINNSFVKSMAKTGDYLKLPLNSERLKKLTESYVVSNEKLKKALGIKNMPITAEDGMMRTLESFGKKD